MSFCSNFIQMNMLRFLSPLFSCGYNRYPSFGAFCSFPSIYNFQAPTFFNFAPTNYINYSNYNPSVNYNNYSYSFNSGIFNVPKYSDNSSKPWMQSYNFTPTITNIPQFNYTFSNTITNSPGKNNSFVNYSKDVSGKIDTSYSTLSKDSAYKKAKSDSRLEELKGGTNWKIAETFYTDIPFARVGTTKILDKVAKEVGEKLTITSALGTKGEGDKTTPHVVGGYKSHHNAENPKLDIAINNAEHGKQLAQKLKNTGYFSHIAIESDHLDVQIDPSKLQSLSVTA